ncbi:hypothetical protein [Methanogenium cariaci]|uniref:DUF7288 family protein n=1 Tax=Methanogenium cariaci TaxID=2197 RepID=UPI0012F6DB1C|nr:hypothetical protein [Methanogenium cariaci]
MNDEGQLYTIEGITAGVIMLVTAFTIFNSGLIYTPGGDAHISDMQMQQLGGYDALQMMDTPEDMSPLSASPLAEMIQNNEGGTEFGNTFSSYLRSGTGTTDIVDSLEFNATVYNRVTSVGGGDTVNSYAFSHSTDSPMSQLTREPAISVTRYVWLPDRPFVSGYDAGEQLVLLEVLIWRR